MVFDIFENKPILKDTYGLVVCGGASSRMGMDKGLIQYYTKPQRYRIYDMLKPLCKEVLISCNKHQVAKLKPNIPYLVDMPEYERIGPMAALLSAFTKFSKKNILFIGCDYPYLKKNDILEFSKVCKTDEPAAFCNAKNNMYEPMLAWYPHSCADLLMEKYEAKQYSLRIFLQQCNAYKFFPENKQSIISIDTYRDYMKAYKTING
ncbi:MAG TPA: molybdenum cofactor guanylyltransferase [Ferruginibacter sp.]|nr:molybdenum cofactor guanylyltransferase [Ferruginibacter sp.]